MFQRLFWKELREILVHTKALRQVLDHSERLERMEKGGIERQGVGSDFRSTRD